MDKGIERKILNMIFAEENYDIQDSEEPDFILKDNKNFEIEFGVEITEFYRDEADARLKNINGYIERILNPKNSKKKPNKGDLRKLPVEEIIVLDEDKKVLYKMQGIVQKALTKKEIDIKLCECINGKEKKLKNYTKKSHENYLIIYDKEGILYGDNSNKIYEYVYGNKLSSFVSESKFREIFIITKSGMKTIYSKLISMQFMNLFSSSLVFANKLSSNPQDKIKLSFNILYNYGFRFKCGIFDIKENMLMDMKKEIFNEINYRDTYVVMYHDCLIKFSAFNTEDFCIIGRIDGLPLGLPVENTIGINLLEYRGDFNLFLRTNKDYKMYINNNEVRHYVNTQNIKNKDIVEIND